MATELLKTMSKRFSDSVEVWTNYIRSVVKNDTQINSKAILQRALQALPKKYRKKTIYFFFLDLFL